MDKRRRMNWQLWQRKRRWHLQKNGMNRILRWQRKRRRRQELWRRRRKNQ